MARVDESTAARISDIRAVIGFRNILAHGYSDVDHELVWSIVHDHLPILLREVDQILPRR